MSGYTKQGYEKIIKKYNRSAFDCFPTLSPHRKWVCWYEGYEKGYYTTLTTKSIIIFLPIKMIWAQPKISMSRLTFNPVK